VGPHEAERFLLAIEQIVRRVKRKLIDLHQSNPGIDWLMLLTSELRPPGIFARKVITLHLRYTAVLLVFSPARLS
jgi:hypothetical protein